MKSWGTFKNEMKAKRRQTGDGVRKKNEEGNILERQELVCWFSTLHREVFSGYSGFPSPKITSI